MSASVAKIISNGTPYGTKVYLSDGRELEGVVRAQWSVEVGGLGELHLELHGSFAIEAEAPTLSVEAQR